MCFRPADAAASGAGAVKCPECGKTIQAMGGVTLKACPFCKADFSPYLNEDGTPKPELIGAPSSPGAPGAPAAPGAPGVPAAPGAPGVSAAPGVSSRS